MGSNLEYFKLEEKNAKQWAVAYIADRKKFEQINYLWGFSSPLEILPQSPPKRCTFQTVPSDEIASGVISK